MSSNQLKLIAALSMLIDHAGLLLFPRVIIFRIIGRLAFPIYAYMIAEGCSHTKNKLRYFLNMFSLALACQIVYLLFAQSTEMCILVTFSLSILGIYVLQAFKKTMCQSGHLREKGFAGVLLIAVTAMVWLMNRYLTIDYGFWGVMTPVFASVFRRPLPGDQHIATRWDSPAVHIPMMCIALGCVESALGGIQYAAFLAVPLLLCYSGKRGERNMKYFFYVFYPAHLVVLQLVQILWQHGI